LERQAKPPGAIGIIAPPPSMLIVAIGTAGETACPTLLDQSLAM